MTSFALARMSLLFALVASVLAGCDDGASSVSVDVSRRDAYVEAETDAAPKDAALDAALDDAVQDVRSLDVVEASLRFRRPEDLTVPSGAPVWGDEDVPCAFLQVSPETAFDAGPGATPCTPGRSLSCRCDTGGAGIQICDWHGRMGPCVCLDRPSISGIDADAGIVVYPGASTVLPPRLIRPLSGRRVMSQRPMLRWELPDGVTRALVELCDDRACTLRLTRAEVVGTSWRSPTPLRPGVVFWHVLGLHDDGSTAWTSATWEFGVRHGDTPIDTIGGPLKDFDGDGFDDALVGIDVLRGGRRVHARPTPTIIAPPLSALGAVAAVGDVNGDGLADVVCNDADSSRMAPEVVDDSYIRIFHGNRGCPIVEAGTVRAPLFGVDVQVGLSFAVGDFNGDGYDDLITTGADVLLLYAGSARGVPRAPASRIALSDLYATSRSSYMRFLGDVDGDGYGDVAVGAYGALHGEGHVYIAYGNPAGHLEARIQRISAPQERSQFGGSVTGGDFNGDGLSDLVVMSATYGVFYYFRGSRDGLMLAQTVTGLSRPGWVGAPGDLGGDGLLDVSFAGSGAVFFSRGAQNFTERPDLSLREAWVVPGWSGGGDVLGSPGDLDGDGIDDLLSYWTYGPPGLPGVLFLFRGGRVGLERPVASWNIPGVRFVE